MATCDDLLSQMTAHFKGERSQLSGTVAEALIRLDGLAEVLRVQFAYGKDPMLAYESLSRRFDKENSTTLADLAALAIVRLAQRGRAS